MRTTSLRARVLSLAALLALGGCSVIVDGSIPDDPPATDSCLGIDDGTTCMREGITAPLICLGGLCTSSRCGDGELDLRPKEDGSVEACDDGNTVAGDGCEPDCSEPIVCTSNAECPDPEIPCMEPSCDTDSGDCSVVESADSTACTDGDNDGVCMDGACVAADCGNGSIDTDEVCDDGNLEGGDGCSAFCRPECLDNNSCQQDACLGYERCEVTTGATGQIGICLPDSTRTTLDCDATCEICDSIAGECVPSPAADADFDGHASTACGGDDCNDAEAGINPALPEICGDGMDSNCNGDADEGAISSWYPDCDDDNYASSSSTPMESCGAPASAPTSCSSGSWTTRAPTGTLADCLDSDPEARPGQREYFTSPYGRTSSYDYDCDTVEEPEYRRAALPTSVACDSRCTSAPVISLTAECGDATTLYVCAESAGVCRRQASSGRYYLGCH